MINPKLESGSLSYGGLIRLFLPLSLSDMIMVVSGPIIAAVIGRLPEVTVQLAAYGVAMSLGLFLEFPITMMLHAGTATAGNPTAYRNLGRILWIWNGIITAVHALVAFTPIYWWVTGTALGLPADVAEAAWGAFAVGLFSSIWVGHRRYMQGQLIYHRRTRQILFSGFFRLGALVGVLLTGATFGLPGAVLAGLASTLGVFSEAAAINWFSRRLRRELAHKSPVTPPRHSDIPQQLGQLFRWYLPLMATQALVVAVPPLMTAGIARAALPALSLAAWPLAWSTVRILANGTRMVQQITISLSQDAESDQVIRRFSAGVGLLFTGLLALVAFSPLAPLYLIKVIGLPDELVDVTRPVLMIGAILPLQVALQNWMQGLLVLANRTVRVNLAALVGGATTLGLVFLGALLTGYPGASIAASAAITGIVVELICLWRFSDRGRVGLRL